MESSSSSSVSSLASNLSLNDSSRSSRSGTQGGLTSERLLKEEELLKAAFDGNIEVVQQLLKDGVSTEAVSHSPGKEGLCSIHLASWKGHIKTVQLLLKAKANRNSAGRGLKAVHYAAKGGHVGVLSTLWDAECYMNSRSSDGQSPLHLAARNGHMNATKWLVEKGTLIYTKDVKGQTAEDLAKITGHHEVASYLREKEEEMRMDGMVGKRKLGEGAFGEVFLMKRKNKYIVIKMISMTELDRQRQEYCHQEIKFMKAMNHPYIVSCLGGGFRDKHLYIMMEFCSGGDLYTRIREQKKKKSEYFEEKLVVGWVLRITLALKYIHARNIIHRDIKPHNIFLTGNGIIKLGDFGLAKSLGDGCQANTLLGSSAYMSPEIIDMNGYGAGADMWAFGCVMFELAALRLAFPFKNMALPFSFSSEFANMIAVLLHKDPTYRPSATDLLEMPLLQDVLGSQLEEKELYISEMNEELEALHTDVDHLKRKIQKETDEIINILKGEEAPNQDKDETMHTEKMAASLFEFFVDNSEFF